MKIGNDCLQQMLYLVCATDKASAIHSVLQTTYYSLQGRLIGATTTSRISTLKEEKFKYPVVIPWSSKLDTVTAWNEICAQGMEMFGLPGHRYITDANVNDMTWWFKDEQDALLMTLKFSEVLA
jgi:hypothetical protein